MKQSRTETTTTKKNEGFVSIIIGVFIKYKNKTKELKEKKTFYVSKQIKNEFYLS